MARTLCAGACSTAVGYAAPTLDATSIGTKLTRSNIPTFWIAQAYSVNLRRIVFFFLMLNLAACSTSLVKTDTAFQNKIEPRSSFLRATSGCNYETTLWQPVASRGPLAVVLGHGFLRKQDNMRGLAEAIAASGYAVATLDFCSMKPWNGHHRSNAAEMIATATYWGFDNVLYAGFSAGALAALVAAANDDNTRGLILLDFVNRAPIGEEALSTLRAPVYALIAEPASCNAHGNGVPLLDAITNSQIEKISDASHCAFESPSNWLCHRLCATDISIDQLARQEIIRGVVDAIKRLSQTGMFTKSATAPAELN